MYVNVELPPGVYRNGTEYQSSGRYYDANLVRWYEGQVMPVGGWRVLSQTSMTGKARSIVTWKDNSNQVWAGVGTHSNLYAMTLSGVVHDITPAGFTTGQADAANGGGYGAGVYGAGAYGLPITSSNAIIPASTWTLDTWGENLVGVMDADNKIYEWSLNTGTPAVAVANAPTCDALIVTGERILMALGVNGNPRAVAWSDQEDNTDWTSTATNQAGDFNLQTNGNLLCGVKIPNGALLFTDTDVWKANYIGTPLIYGFPLVGDGAGAISRKSVVAIDGRVIWMSAQGFWSYSGFIQPLQCDVSDFVFTNINRSQISKVTSFHNSAYGEIWWFYPDNENVENNRYVVYSYREGHWSIGETVRLSAADMAPFANPLMVDGSGDVYEHEVGLNHDGEAAFAEGGPLEVNSGNEVLYLHQYIPDQRTTGDATLTIKARYYPLGDQEIYGAYPAAELTDIRASGRQFNIRYDATDNVDWRIGKPRIDGTIGGKR